MSLTTEWLGLIDYEKALGLQMEAVDRVRSKKSLHVLGLEHPSVVTFGKRATVESDLPWGKDVLREKNISLIETDRGGQATLHSPGQLVIYPIVPLAEWDLGVRQFVELLEETTREALLRIDIATHRRPGDPGVFTERGKLAFCGIRVDRGVSRHGISINVKNELGLFELIRPCGALARPLDKVQNYINISTKELFTLWSQCFISKVPGTFFEAVR